jgi:hypothetical protein
MKIGMNGKKKFIYNALMRFQRKNYQKNGLGKKGLQRALG